MIASPPAKPQSQDFQKAANGELGGVYLAAGYGRVWVIAFIAGLISLSIVSVAIFSGTDGQRGLADWLLLILFPLLVSALLATFVSMFLAPQTDRRAENEADYPAFEREADQPKRPDKPSAIPSLDDRRPPFTDWIARELAANEFGSLNVALDSYIATFDLPRQRRSNEPNEITNYRLKLAILKDNLLEHPEWKEAPELKEYVADLEFLLAFYEPGLEAKHEQSSVAG